jgi:glucose-1-phosphatase
MKRFAKKVRHSPEEIWSAIEKDPFWHDWQEGRISPSDWHRHMNRKLGGSLSLEEFSEAWNFALDPEPIHENSLFERLAGHCTLALLSNTDPIHVAYLEATYDFFRYFPPERRTYSCVAGASKPSPLIFQRALETAHVAPSQAVFIDDIEQYVDAARQLGISGIHFRSPQQLTSELQARGLLSAG